MIDLFFNIYIMSLCTFCKTSKLNLKYTDENENQGNINDQSAVKKKTSSSPPFRLKINLFRLKNRFRLNNRYRINTPSNNKPETPTKKPPNPPPFRLNNLFRYRLKKRFRINRTSNNKIDSQPQVIYSKKKYALLIGINYINTNYKLNGCINDMNNLKKMLLNKKYSNQNIKLLSDITETKATKNNILKQLKVMLSQAKKGDECFFSFSGHGIQIKDSSNDELDGKDECLVASDFKNIVDDELKIIIKNNLKKGVKLFCLIDCCHSGTILDLKYNYKYTIKDKDYYDNKKSSETLGNVCMISGCMDSQVSMDAKLDGQYAGALTYSFLKNINIRKTWDSLLTGIRNTLILKKFKQIPQFSTGLKENILLNHYLVN